MLRDAAAHTALAVLAATLWLTVLALGAGLTSQPAPAPSRAVLIAVLGGVAGLGLWFPLAALYGWFMAVGRLQASGGWRALRGSGLGGRSLILPGLTFGLGCAVLAAGLAGHVGPLASAHMRDLLHQSLLSPSLTAGRPARLGGVELVAHEVDGGRARAVFAVGPDLFVHAEEVDVRRHERGLELAARGVVLTRPRLRVEAQEWRWLVEAPDRRIELDERSNTELLEVARRSALGGVEDRYERAVWVKRHLHPLGLLWLPLGLTPFALRPQRWLVFGGVAIASLLLIRLGDGLATVLGPWLAAGLTPGLFALVGCAAWAHWWHR